MGGRAATGTGQDLDRDGDHRYGGKGSEAANAGPGGIARSGGVMRRDVREFLALLSVQLVWALLGVGVAGAQTGWVCVDDPAGDAATRGAVNVAQTGAVDLLRVCGLYSTDGVLTLDFTVVDAAASESWPADSPPSVNSLLDRPEFVFVQGVLGGRSDVYLVDPELGLEPYCASPDRPQGSASLQLVGNTYRVSTAPGCIDVDVVSARGLGAQRADLDQGRGADDSVGALQFPRTDAQPPPLDPPPPAAVQDPDGVVRLYGPSRFETAVAISQDLWSDGQAGTAVVVTAGNFADAQTATPLAAGRGPLLLSGVDGLHPATGRELTRAVVPGASVYLIGGTAALGEQVAADIVLLGFDVRRLAGSGRAETSVAIAEEITSSPQRILFVDGGTFPPGILAGAAAGGTPDTVVVSGGAGVAYIAAHPTAEAIQVGASSMWDPAVTRTITAPDPTQLSIAVATTLDLPRAQAGLASADAFPDGLAGSVHAASGDFPVFLTPGDHMPAALAERLADPVTETVYVYGGPAAISPDVTNQAVGQGAPPGPAVALRQEGLGLPDGSVIVFGAGAEPTLQQLTDQLGAATADTGWVGGTLCFPEERLVGFDGLVVRLGRTPSLNRFIAYDATAPHATSTGMSGGVTTLGALRATHPDATVDTTEVDGTYVTYVSWRDGTSSGQNNVLSSTLETSAPPQDATVIGPIGTGACF